MSVFLFCSPNTGMIANFAIFIQFTQTFRRLKDIYECYILGNVFLKKNENEEEENEEEIFHLLYFILFPLK